MEESREISNGVSPEFEKADSSNLSLKNCALCGCSTPAVRCDKCGSQVFCLSCDDMYHRHPKRRFHLRKAVDSIWNSHRSPRLRRRTELPGDPSKIPIPPPRTKKRDNLVSGFPKLDFKVPPFMMGKSSPDAKKFMNFQNVASDSKNNQVLARPKPDYENTGHGLEENDSKQTNDVQMNEIVSNGGVKSEDTSNEVPSPIHVSVPADGHVVTDMHGRKIFGFPTHYPVPGMQHSLSVTDITSASSSSHPPHQPGPIMYHWPQMHPMMHPYSHSVAHLNCPHCVSSSWSNLMSPHSVSPYFSQPQSASNSLPKRQIDPSSSGSNVSPVAPFPYPAAAFCPFVPMSPVPPTFVDQCDVQNQNNISFASNPTQNIENQMEESAPACSEVGDAVASSCSEEESEEQEDEPQIPEKPSEPWECIHCTYINPPGDHICQVCCRTSYGIPPAKKEKSKRRKKSKESKKDSEPVADKNFSAAMESSPVVIGNESESVNNAEKLLEHTAEQYCKPDDDTSIATAEHVECEEITKLNVGDVKAESCDSESPLKTEINEQNQENETVLKEPCDIETMTEIVEPPELFTTETQTAVSTTSTDVQTQKITCMSTASSTDSMFALIRREMSVQTELNDVTQRRSIATDPMISSHSMESLLSGVSAPPYHNRRAGMGRTASSFSMQSLCGYDRGRSRSPVPRSFSYGRGLNFPTQDTSMPSWSQSWLASDPMYFKPHGLRAFSHSPSREEYFDGVWGSMDRLNKGSKKKVEGSWKTSPGKVRLHRSLEDLKQQEKPDATHIHEIEFLQIVKAAERCGFTIEDLKVAYYNCGNVDPVFWLQDNWNTMVKNVISLAAKYGMDNEENDVGAISAAEAKEALYIHKGNIWDAAAECIEIRQRKILELTVRGNFTQKQIAEALKNNDGNVELAYADLIRSSTKLFKHILSPGLSEESEDISICAPLDSEATTPEIKITSKSQPLTHHSASEKEALPLDSTKEEKRSDFYTKLSAIRQAQHERRRAREEKMHRTLDTASTEVASQQEILESFARDIPEHVSSETYSQNIPSVETVNLPETASICTEHKQLKDNMDIHRNEDIEKVAELETLDQEEISEDKKDDGIPEDYDSHWIDSQGEWIEEYSDEQWDDEGGEEWIQVRTKYRKLGTDIEVDDQQMASLWEKEELVDDVFIDDSCNLDDGTVDSAVLERQTHVQTDRESDWPTKSAWHSRVQDHDHDILHAEEEISEDTQRVLSMRDSFEIDSNDNWIVNDAEKLLRSSQSEGFVIDDDDKLQTSDLKTKEFRDTLPNNEKIENNTIIELNRSSDVQSTFKHENDQNFEIIHDSLSDGSIDEEWVKIEPENEVEIITNDELRNIIDSGQTVNDTVLYSIEEKEKREEMPSKTVSDLIETEDNNLNMKDVESDVKTFDFEIDESGKPMKLPPKRQKKETLPQVSTPSECKNISEENQQYFKMEEEVEIQPPPIPVKRKSKLLETSFEPLTDKNQQIEEVKQETVDSSESLKRQISLHEPEDNICEDISHPMVETTLETYPQSLHDAQEINNAEASADDIPVITDLDVMSQDLSQVVSNVNSYEDNLSTDVASKDASPIPSCESDSNFFADSESEVDLRVTKLKSLKQKHGKIDKKPDHFVAEISYESKSENEIEKQESEDRNLISVSPTLEDLVKNDNYKSDLEQPEYPYEREEALLDEHFTGNQFENSFVKESFYSPFSESLMLTNIIQKSHESSFFDRSAPKAFREDIGKPLQLFKSEKPSIVQDIKKDGNNISEEKDAVAIENIHDSGNIDIYPTAEQDRLLFFSEEDFHPDKIEFVKEQSFNEDQLHADAVFVTDKDNLQCQESLVLQQPMGDVSLKGERFEESYLQDLNEEEIFQSTFQEPSQFEAKHNDENALLVQDTVPEILQENIQQVSVTDEFELPALSEMEATSAAADYFFGRYNEVVVTRKGKKKPPIGKQSKVTEVKSSPKTMSSSIITIDNKEISIPQKDTSCTVSMEIKTNVQDSKQQFESTAVLTNKTEETNNIVPLPEQSLTTADVLPKQSLTTADALPKQSLTTADTLSKQSLTTAQQIQTKTENTSAEYLSFAEDYFFGSYNEVIIPKKGKKKQSALGTKPIKSNIQDNEAKKSEESKPHFHVESVEEDKTLKTFDADVSKPIDSTVIESDGTNVISAGTENTSSVENVESISHPSERKEQKHEDQIQRHDCEATKLCDITKPSVSFEKSTIPDISNNVPKTKSVRFENLETQITPPPRTKKRQGNVKREMLSGIDSKEAETSDSIKQSTPVYAAEEYLFGRYNEVVPNTKDKSHISNIPLTKKKTSTQ